MKFTLQIFADDEEAGPEEVGTFTTTEPEGVEPLEGMLTPEVVGELGPEDLRSRNDCRNACWKVHKNK
jgi:hypothetical protein